MHQMRTLVAGIVLVALVSACAGATPSGTSPAATASPGTSANASSSQAASPSSASTIRFMCWEGDLGSVADINAKLLAPFTAATGIKVDYEVAPWPEYWTKIGTLAAANQMPDVYCQSVAYAWDHAHTKVAANLTPMFTSQLNETDYYLTGTDATKYPNASGDLYAMPFRMAVGMIYYNKDLFDAAGVAYPTDDWTWDDLRAAAKTLSKDTDNDGAIDQWGYWLGSDNIQFDAIIKANGGKVLNDNLDKCELNQPNAIASIQWMVDAIKNDHISPAPGGYDTKGLPPFATGKVAMTSELSVAQFVYKDVKFKYDVAAMPKGTVDRVVYGGPDTLSISTSAKDPEAARKLLAYIIGPDVQKNQQLLGVGAIPFYRPAAEDPAYLSTPGLPGNFKVALDAFSHMKGADFSSHWIEWRDALTQQINAALSGQKSAASAAADACAAIDSILAASTQ
jgi:multiple sugar transport system substrate-binding protein